jgi:hypothetical protein
MNNHAVSAAHSANKRHAKSGTAIARNDIVIAPKSSVPVTRKFPAPPVVAVEAPASQHRSALHYGRRTAASDQPERPGERGIPPRDAGRCGENAGHYGGGSGQRIEQVVLGTKFAPAIVVPINPMD